MYDNLSRLIWYHSVLDTTTTYITFSTKALLTSNGKMAIAYTLGLNVNIYHSINQTLLLYCQLFSILLVMLITICVQLLSFAFVSSGQSLPQMLLSSFDIVIFIIAYNLSTVKHASRISTHRQSVFFATETNGRDAPRATRQIKHVDIFDVTRYCRSSAVPENERQFFILSDDQWRNKPVKRCPDTASRQRNQNKRNATNVSGKNGSIWRAVLIGMHLTGESVIVARQRVWLVETTARAIAHDRRVNITRPRQLDKVDCFHTPTLYVNFQKSYDIWIIAFACTIYYISNVSMYVSDTNVSGYDRRTHSNIALTLVFLGEFISCMFLSNQYFCHCMTWTKFLAMLLIGRLRGGRYITWSIPSHPSRGEPKSSQ